MFIPTKIITMLKHKSKILINQINYKGFILKQSIFDNNDPKIQVQKC